MPKLLLARPPLDAKEEHQIRRLAGSRHAPADWILRAKMIVGSWERKRTTTIATKLRCHPQTVRERIIRFNAEGLDGLGDRPGAGRKPRLTEQERGTIIALARAAHDKGIQVERSQIRRILLKEGIRWRHPRSWAQSTDREFVPKGRGSSLSTPTRQRERRSSPSTSLVP